MAAWAPPEAADETQQSWKPPEAADSWAPPEAESAPAAPGTPGGYLEDRLLTGLGVGSRGRGILANAETGLAETAKSLVPKSLSDILGFASPVTGAVEDISKTARTLSDVLFGGKTAEEATRANRPEDFALADADKTPAFSKERFTAGFGTAAQMLMAGGIVHGLRTPTLAETLFPSEKAPATETPPAPAEVAAHADEISRAVEAVTPPQPTAVIPQEIPSPGAGEPIEQAPMAEVLAPEPTAPAPKTFRGPADAFGSEVTPVASYLIDNVGGLVSKSAAQKARRFAGNEDLWNGAQDALSHPTHNKVYNPTGETPDAAAQSLYDAGLIKEATPDAMWDALRHESQTSRTVFREGRAQAQAADAAHAEWQDQLKQGERDPVVQLMTQDGEGAANITRSEDGKGVELWHRDPETGEATNISNHATLDDALKEAHSQGLLLDEGAQSGRPIFENETAPQAGAQDSGTPRETQPAQPEVPRLRPGETQGDLLSRQAEDLKLVGERGTDFGARQALEEAAAKAKSEGAAASDALQSKLFEGANDWAGATEPSGKGMRLSKAVGQSGAIPNPLASPIVAKALKAIEIRKMSPLDAATTERSARLQQSFADAERAQKEIAKVAPTERRQGAISVWMEANGDQATLDQWATTAKGQPFKQAATEAKNLTAGEIAIARKAQGAFAALETRGNQYDVLGNHRDNYVPHVWDVDKKGTGIGSSKLQDRFKFNKARTFDNFYEGDQAGFTPKTLAIGKLLPAYLHEMNKVIADRQFVQDVSHMTGTDNRPLVVPRGNAKTVDTTDYVVRNKDGSPLPKFQKAVYDTQADAQAALKPGQTIEKRPSSSALVNPRGFAKAEDTQGNPIDQRDYKTPDQPALNNWRWVETDPQGNTTILKSDLAVHPELAKRLNATMGQSAIRQWYNEPSTGISVIPKAIAKGLDTAQSVMKREMFSLLAPFHQVQEGTHAIGHTVNPFGGLEDMSKPTPDHVDAMQHGLMLLPDKSSAAGYIEGLGGRGGFVAQAGRWLGDKAPESLAGKAGNALASTVDGYQNYLFHQYIPGLKYKTYEHMLERNMDRYADDLKSGKVSESDVKLLSAEQSNAAYGHINYALLDRNPTMQHIMQLSLLAPDFLEARGRFVGQAAKALIGEKTGREQFRAVAVLAATQAATMYTLSQVLGGEYDWKKPFEFTLNGRSYLLRSVPEDLHRLLFQGPDVRREFVSARVNPTLQKVDQLRTGLNYRGEKTGALDTMGELVANYIPITARWIPGVRQLTQTSKNSPVSPLEQLAGSMGLKISRYSAITQTHQIAAQWMDKQGISREQGTYPTSKFTPLRYALEDADLPRAEKEWKKLVGDNGDEKKLAEGFKSSINHPFTGNKARDEDFANSLKGKDRLMYDRALEVRQGILDKFGLIH